MSEITRPTQIIIDLSAIAHNYREIARHVAPAQVMPVLKANAYGHGLVECARVLEGEGACYLAVAFLEEAIALREAGIRTRILALGGFSGRQLEHFIAYDIDCAASSVDKIQQLDALAAKQQRVAKVHLKIDTGMERIGTHYYSAEKLLQAAAAAKHCEVCGIFSHCARAEDDDVEYTKLQLERFEQVLALARSMNVLKKGVLRHLANSGAICNVPATNLDYVRAGLLLYGYAPRADWQDRLQLRPALRLRSEVVFFKVIEEGAAVSYDHTWRASKRTRIVTVPIGYGDGYMRAMSNRAEVLIRGKRYPVVGRVCMDQFLVDIGWDSAFNGDEVMLLGAQGEEVLSLHELAHWAQTDPREIICALNARIPRSYENGS